MSHQSWRDPATLVGTNSLSLKSAARSGVASTGTVSVFITALQFIQLTVLARILAPQDFGLMAMVLLVTGLGHTFTDMGVSNAIIQRRDVTREQLTSLFWLNIFAGVALFGLIVACAPLVSAFFGEPRLTSLTRIFGS
jgi:O-antigen/teichoic acid export membrane protein